MPQPIADTLPAQFQGVRSTVKERREGGQLRVCVNSAVQVTDDGRVVPHDEAEAFDVVILAVGFGIEALPFDLPWNSYWRVDPLGQTLLDEDIAQPSVVIVGSGDGALIRRPPELRPDLR